MAKRVDWMNFSVSLPHEEDQYRLNFRPVEPPVTPGLN